MLQFFLSLIIFLIAVVFCFAIPGLWILTKAQTKLQTLEKIILGSALGFVLFSLLNYLFLVLNLQILTFIPITVIDFLFLKNFKKVKPDFNLLPQNQLILLVVFFLIGITMQLAVISPSGLNINGDLLFWSSHAHDSAWHIALMNQMAKGWPIINPALSGEKVLNYHFFSDIAPSYFSSFFKISSLDLYFRFFPLFYSLLFASLLYMVGKKLTGNFWGGFWSLIFADFGGSFGYIVTLLRDRSIGGESLFWSSQPQSTIGNPPQIAALVLLLAFVYLFTFFLENKNRWLFLGLFLISGSLLVFKVYAGIALLGSLAPIGVWQILRERRFEIFSLFLSGTLLSSVLYFPNSSGSTSFLIFQPWWYIRTMVVSPDRLGELDWELRRQTYLSQGNIKRVIQLETESFLIFFLGNLGMRFLGLLALPKFLKGFFKSYTNELIILIPLISFVFPMLFLQKGVASNTSQFLQYFLLFMGILSAIFLCHLFIKIKSSLVKTILGGLIIILAIPTQLGLLNQFYSRPAFTKIDSMELQALNYLKTNTSQDSVILSPPFNKYLHVDGSTPPVWAWSDTNYIGAFGDRATYLSDQEQVDIMGYDYSGRKDLLNKIFTESNPQNFDVLVKQTGANYLYFPKLQSPKADLNKTGLQEVFSNNEIEIWEIK